MSEEKTVQDAPQEHKMQDVTPVLWFDEKKCSEALSFYEKAFDAKVTFKMEKEGTIVHSAIQIANAKFILNDIYGDNPETPGSGSNYVCVPDVDKLVDLATKAGCKVISETKDQFWGDRMGKVRDPYGHCWAFASRLPKDQQPSQEEMAKGGDEWWANMKKAAAARKRGASEVGKESSQGEGEPVKKKAKTPRRKLRARTSK